MAFVQRTDSNSELSASSHSRTFGTATVQGNLVLVFIQYEGSVGGISSVTDTAGNTYALVAEKAGSTGRVTALYMGVQVTGGITTVTVNYSPSTTRSDVFTAEFNGIAGSTNAAVLDASATNNATSASPSTSLTPSAAGKLIIGCVGAGANNPTLTAGSGYTSFGVINYRVTGEYKLSGAASETVNGTLAFSASWAMVAASFNVNTTVRPTITGKSRIQKTVTRTITGVSRIQNIVDQTITGKSAIQNTTAQTITGKASVQQTASQSIDGVARVQNTIDATITGISRITNATSQTIQGTSRIQSPVDVTIEGLSRIQKPVDVTITGVSRIQQQVLATIDGIARIQQVESATITGKARLQGVAVATIQGVSRVTAVTTRNISGKAMITTDTPTPETHSSAAAEYNTHAAARRKILETNDIILQIVKAYYS